MAALAAGQVGLVTFPFSDLSETKLRPALVLADAGCGDWIMCQITSNAFSDPNAIELTTSDFQRGSLRRISFARPNKLFTGHRSLASSHVGTLTPEALQRVLAAVIHVFSSAS